MLSTVSAGYESYETIGNDSYRGGNSGYSSGSYTSDTDSWSPRSISRSIVRNNDIFTHKKYSGYTLSSSSYSQYCNGYGSGYK